MTTRSQQTNQLSMLDRAVLASVSATAAMTLFFVAQMGVPSPTLAVGPLSAHVELA